MGIKRTIDSGRKDKKGRPIKVSGNSLAASDNVNSKKSQLAQSVPQRDGSKYREVFDSVGKLDIPMRITHNGDISTTHDLANDFARGGNGEDYQIEFDGLGDHYEKQANLKTIFPEWDGHNDMETEDGFIVSKKGLFTTAKNIVGDEKSKSSDYVFHRLKQLNGKSCLNKSSLNYVVGKEVKSIVSPQDWDNIAQEYAQKEYPLKDAAQVKKDMDKEFNQIVSDNMVHGDNSKYYANYRDYLNDKEWATATVTGNKDHHKVSTSIKDQYDDFVLFVANNRHEYMNDEENGLSPESVRDGAVSMFLKGYR